MRGDLFLFLFRLFLYVRLLEVAAVRVSVVNFSGVRRFAEVFPFVVVLLPIDRLFEDHVLRVAVRDHRGIFDRADRVQI